MSQRTEQVQMLRHVPLFARFSADTLESLARQMSKHTYEAGAMIIR